MPEKQDGWFYLAPDGQLAWSAIHPVESGECIAARQVEAVTLDVAMQHLYGAWARIADMTTPTPTAPSEGGAGCGAGEVILSSILARRVTAALDGDGHHVLSAAMQSALAAPSSAPAQWEVSALHRVLRAMVERPQASWITTIKDVVQVMGELGLKAPVSWEWGRYVMADPSTPAPASEAVRDAWVAGVEAALDVVDTYLQNRQDADDESERALLDEVRADIDALTPPSEAAGKGGAS